MKIEKINDNQIKIILSSNDLAERNLNINELAYSNEKMQSLFREMLEQALIEHSFQPDANIPLMIEAALLSSDSIMIIVTKVSGSGGGAEVLDLVPKPKTERQFRKKGIVEPQQPVRNDGLYVYSFGSLDDVLNVSDRLAGRLGGNSMLYRITDKYYLVIKIKSTGEGMGSLSGEALDMLLGEYGQKHIGNDISVSFILEHGEKILDENAVERLSGVN